MAVSQFNYAWAFELIEGGTTHRFATRDLPEAAAVTTLGGFFIGAIKAPLPTVRARLDDLGAGIALPDKVTLAIDNRDLTLTSATDYREMSVRLRHYDVDTDTATTLFQGNVTEAQFIQGNAFITCSSIDEGLLSSPLPAIVLGEDATATEFDNAADIGSPIPVVFGMKVPVRVVDVNNDISTDDPGGYDHIVSHGTGLRVNRVYYDMDSDGKLNDVGRWTTAPGTPVYASTSTFTVTGNTMPLYYNWKAPFRCKTTAGGDDFQYSTIYTPFPTGTAGTVTLLEAILDAGMTVPSYAGGWINLPGGYASIGTVAASYTAFRMYDQTAGGVVAIVDNLDAGMQNPANVIGTILTNSTWGLSYYKAQTINAASFAAAATALGTATMGTAPTNMSLGTAVSGVLGASKAQRRAADVLGELLLMRGMRLGKNVDGEWTLTVDSVPAAAVATFAMNDGKFNNIYRVSQLGRLPTNQAASKMRLFFSESGRSRDKGVTFRPEPYQRFASINLASVGVTQTTQSSWIRNPDIAALVTYYLGKRMGAADFRITITVGEDGRGIVVGDLVAVVIAEDGVFANYYVIGTAKSIDFVTLELAGYDATAYTTTASTINTAVGITNEPVERTVDEVVTLGGNVCPNSSFAPPDWVDPSSGWLAPSRWGFTLEPTSWELDASEGTRSRCISEHYLSITWPSDTTIDFPLWASPIGQQTMLGSLHPNSTGQFSVLSTQLYIISVYCDKNEGLYFGVGWWDSAGLLISPYKLGVAHWYDTADVNGNGWGRWRAYIRSPSTAKSATVIIGFTRAQAYQLEAVQVEAGALSQALPSDWRIDRPQSAFGKKTLPVVLTSNPGVGSQFFPAGITATGITGRVSGNIVMSGTGYSIGTTVDPIAWGSGFAGTVAGNTFRGSTQFPIHYASATDIVVTCEGGTFTAGTVILHAEYLKPAIASGT